MTHHDDDPAFNEYLKRDSALSQRYKAATEEDVPPALDQKILMQARDAVSNRKIITHSSWWVKWNKPLALAASLMLAFTVMYRVGHQSIEQLTMSPALPPLQDKAAVPTNTSAAALVPQEKITAANEPPKPALKGTLLAKQPPPAPPAREELPEIAPVLSEHKAESPPIVGGLAAAPVISSGPANASDKAVAKSPEPQPKQEVGIVDSITSADIGQLPDRSVGESMQRIPGIKVDRLNSRDEKRKASANADPETQLRHIRQLRKQGKQKEAGKAWKQFQKDFPDFVVAADDEVRG